MSLCNSSFCVTPFSTVSPPKLPLKIRKMLLKGFTSSLYISWAESNKMLYVQSFAKTDTLLLSAHDITKCPMNSPTAEHSSYITSYCLPFTFVPEEE